MRNERKLIRESAWMRVFSAGSRTLIYSSKFQTDALEVPAAFLRERWHGWLHSAQLEFASAFTLKPSLTPEDHEIIAFLMEEGSNDIQSAIATMLPKYRDRERAMAFLLKGAARCNRGVSGYYGALARIADARAIPVLRQRYESYRRELPPFEEHGLHSELADYQDCCRALWRLDPSVQYPEALKELLEHPDKGIAQRSRFFLSEALL